MNEFNQIKSQFINFTNKPFRPNQENIISFVRDSRVKIPVIWAPTGFGKSLANVCSGFAYSEQIDPKGVGFTYLVSSKQLQDQLEYDFPELRVMKGRNNYNCTLQPGRTCEDCLHSKAIRCPHKNNCEYEKQKRYVLAGQYKLLNYHYFLYESNYIGRFSGASPIIICDEGDLLEHLLSDFVSLSISGRIQKQLNINPPKYKTTESDKSVPEWIQWANMVLDKLVKRLQTIELYLQDQDLSEKDKLKLNKEKKALSSAAEKCKIFKDNVDSTWILEYRKAKFGGRPTLIFKPTWLTETLSDMFFFRHANKFLLSSATFHPKIIMGRLLGRESDEFDYIEAPSTFPVENRQVYLWPVANLTYKTFELEASKTVAAVKEILDIYHPDDKGIIHTVSYKLADRIREYINSDRLMFHGADDRTEVLNEFKQSDYPHVLVSPSMERGVDLPGDEARFTIICKAPFESLADKLVNKRLYSGNAGKLWYRSTTAQNIVQMCGRAVRSESDFAKSYVLDKQATDLIINNQELFPQYFMEAVEVM